jgi:hypothetical protein
MCHVFTNWFRFMPQGICTQYAVPLAIINGKQLAELSEESMARGGEVVPMEDLLGCIKNIQQVAAVLQQPGRRYKGPTGPSEVRELSALLWRVSALQFSNSVMLIVCAQTSSMHVVWSIIFSLMHEITLIS